MYDVLRTPRLPNPTVLFKPPLAPPLGTWTVQRSRRKREMEVYADPFRGQGFTMERQVQLDRLRTTRMAVALERELARAPTAFRRNMPPSGNYPTVTDVDPGPGPNPFFGPAENPDEVLERLERPPRKPQDRDPGVANLARNNASYQDGPGSRPSIFAGPLRRPVPMEIDEPLPLVTTDGEPLAQAERPRPPVGAPAPPPNRRTGQGAPAAPAGRARGTQTDPTTADRTKKQPKKPTRMVPPDYRLVVTPGGRKRFLPYGTSSSTPTSTAAGRKRKAGQGEPERPTKRLRGTALAPAA